MVLIEQISAMLDFLESHPDLALGYCSRSMEGRSLAKRLWIECAQILNCIAADCPNKSPTEWRSFYNEFKCKLMKKIKDQKAEMSATGGGPAKKIILTSLQERLLNILGRDIGEPLPGVRHNPLNILPANPALAMEVDAGTNASTANNSFSILEAFDMTSGEVIEPLRISVEPEMVGRQLPRDPQPPIDLQPSSLQPQASPPQASPPQAQPRPNQLLRRRRRPTQRAEGRDHAALEAAQARLEQIEARNAEATLAQAEAIQSLAAASLAQAQAVQSLAAASLAQAQAVQSLAAATNRLAVAIEKKRRRIILTDSESE